MNNVKLGDKCEDIVSGFTGVATVMHIYSEGEDRFTIQPRVDNEGKLPESSTFDVSSLKVIEEQVVKFDPSKNPSNNNIEFGYICQDSLTKLEGTIVAKHIFLNNCIQYSIQPPVNKKGELPDNYSFDQGRIIVKKKDKYQSKHKEEKPGGPEQYIPKQNKTSMVR
jgi:hypothetical protein